MSVKNAPGPLLIDYPSKAGRVGLYDPSGQAIDSSNPLPVVVTSGTPSSTSIINTYNQVLSVPSGSPVDIITYIVPSLGNVFIQRVSVSGENIARFDVLINGSPLDTRRTYFGGNLNEYFDFIGGSALGQKLTSGDIIVVRVEHNRDSLANFEARLQVAQVTA